MKSSLNLDFENGLKKRSTRKEDSLKEKLSFATCFMQLQMSYTTKSYHMQLKNS